MSVRRQQSCHRPDGRSPSTLPAPAGGLERVDQLAQGQLRLAAQHKVERGEGSSVSRGIGVTCVPKAIVIAPRLRARKTPYMSLVSVGAVTCVR